MPTRRSAQLLARSAPGYERGMGERQSRGDGAGEPDPVSLALGELGGAVIVLDRELRIAAATPGAAALLGFPPPIGEKAVRVLCGEAPRRPIAEALAAGRPVEATIPRPNRSGDTLVRVRALPLGASGASESRAGWLLLLEDVGAASAEGAVDFHGIWTQDPGMKRVLAVVERVAGADTTVLVRGETGSGKELVARALHDISPRRAGPYRALNCAALPGSLLESELFGHARGAFTGAVRETPGHVQLAHGGTLFLDEVAELPLELQAKLLRVLETHTVIPVGAREPIPVDVRVVSATHRALRREVEAGRFRADLMFRLRVIPIFLPPLRARPGDVRLLSERFVALMNERSARRIEQISPAALEILEAYAFPGNVRELMNVLTYAYAIGEGAVLRPADLPPELHDPTLSLDADDPSARAEPALPRAEPRPPLSPEAQRIVHVLERAAGNRSRAARILGLSRVTLWRKMKTLGLA
jgi:transcriptional regulator with PAS, ATPase and Fis domain